MGFYWSYTLLLEPPVLYALLEGCLALIPGCCCLRQKSMGNVVTSEIDVYTGGGADPVVVHVSCWSIPLCVYLTSWHGMWPPPPPLSSVLAHGKWSKTGRGESLKTRLIKFRLGILLMCDAWTLSGHNQFLKEARPTWHARSPTVSTRFDQCNTSPHQLLLGWPGDGDCYLMDKMQSGGWPYPHDMCMFVDVLHN